MSDRNSYSREEIIRKKKGRSRKESMDEIISQYSGWFQDSPRIELVLSARDYPYYYNELKFNQRIFDTYFKKLPERSFLLDGFEYKLFDPKGEINNNSSWTNLSKGSRYPISIIIKLDGTIYIVIKLNEKREEGVIINTDWLQCLLTHLFEEIIEIYSNMNYSGDKRVQVRIVNFQNCKISVGYSRKLYSSKVSENLVVKDFVFHHDHPSNFPNNIFNYLKRLFSFTSD
ncbi:hypothetical protein LCGC14_1087200 [marine sediment metagenome]|uniref:Uncharacterized protein n=1 Tax=marine sediment metagenome TaxID=412755 RepID=A0A0F9QJG3_9ZZZZ